MYPNCTWRKYTQITIEQALKWEPKAVDLLVEKRQVREEMCLIVWQQLEKSKELVTDGCDSKQGLCKEVKILASWSNSCCSCDCSSSCSTSRNDHVWWVVFLMTSVVSTSWQTEKHLKAENKNNLVIWLCMRNYPSGHDDMIRIRFRCDVKR